MANIAFNFDCKCGNQLEFGIEYSWDGSSDDFDFNPVDTEVECPICLEDHDTVSVMDANMEQVLADITEHNTQMDDAERECARSRKLGENS